MAEIGDEKLASFSTADFLVLDTVHRDSDVPASLRANVQRLLNLGVIEPISRNKFILSRRLYAFLDQRGVYTRRRGLNHETNKQLLLQHIRNNDGSPMRDMLQVLPHLSRDQVKALVYELRDENLISMSGTKRAALWISATRS